jgi:predicted RND superfamily exporter protein
MWQKVASSIIRYRLLILIVMAGLTTFMGYKATKVELQYEFGALLPEKDSTNLEYLRYRRDYGQDGLVIVISTETDQFFTLEKYNQWKEMGDRIKAIQVKEVDVENPRMLNPIDSVFSEAHLFNLVKNKDKEIFELARVLPDGAKTQEQVDSVKNLVNELPFYENIVFKKDPSIHLMMIFVNESVFNSKSRGDLVPTLESICEEYEADFGQLRYSGLPYVRAITMNKVKGELGLFVLLALVVTAIVLYIFYRSMKVVITSLIVVGIGVIWSIGSIGLFDFQITVLMGLMPPLMIVIGIPNCVYLITKYQQEYLLHGNKAKALTRVIRKVGNATFLTNATTSMGFATFLLTHSKMMQEFGLIASLNILSLFLISILIVPIVYSYFPAPKEKHTKHLDKKWLDKAIDILLSLTNNHRGKVYFISIGIVTAGIIGIAQMKTSGNIVDDLPKGDQVVKDLRYFEKEFNGVMPFEVLVRSEDTIYSAELGYRNAVMIDSIQTLLAKEDKLSKSISIVNGIKYLSQAYSDGNPERYEIPSFDRIINMKSNKLITNTLDQFRLIDSTKKSSFLTGFLNENQKETRITVQIKDIGIDSMKHLLRRVKTDIRWALDGEQRLLDSVIATKEGKSDAVEFLFSTYPWIEAQAEAILIAQFPEMEDKFDEGLFISELSDSAYLEPILTQIVHNAQLNYTVTGSGIIYTEGTTYLVKNLFTSLFAAILMIAILMAVLFRSWRMVIVSLIPNILPLVFTSGLMGFLGIPIKPSTILVFSIAFGISVDDTIHFLAKYRQELKLQSWNIKGSVTNSIKETGVSMIYTSIILFFGFSIFIASSFGGTQALGILVSVTLFIAMLANLVLLPSLLLSLEKFATTKAFKEPLLEIVDEEEDIEIDELEIKENTYQ